MNKTWKSLVALTAGGALAMSGMVGVSSALAIDGTETTNVTDNKIYNVNAKLTINNVVKGDAFKGYQLLFLDSESADGKIYLVNDVYKDAIKAGIKAVLGDGYDADNFNTDAKIISWLTTDLTGGTLNADGTVTMADTTNIDKFTAGFMGASPNNPAFTATAAEGATSVKVSNVPVGFYLIEHTSVGDDDTSDLTTYTTSKYMAMNISSLNGGNNVINLKNGTVTLDKSIVEGNEEKEISDYDAGDIVSYRLEGTLPANYADFSEFAYTFYDVMDDTLELTPAVTADPDNGVQGATQGNVKIELVQGDTSTDITNGYGFNIAYGQEVQTPTNESVTAALVVSAANLKQNTTFAAGDKIVVTYDAVVTKNAVFKNNNSSWVQFSNNPNQTTTSNTPVDIVTAVTFGLTVNKTFSGGNPADNDMPEFTLYTVDANGNVSANPYTNSTYDESSKETGAVKVVKGADGTYKLNISGLDSGTYQLKETKAPAGYNQAAPITFQIVPEYDQTAGTIKSLKVLMKDASGVFTDPPIENGVAVMSISAVDGDGFVTTGIENKAGSELPSTGGMGTVLLYTVGGLVVLIAAAGLTIALKRRQS